MNLSLSIYIYIIYIYIIESINQYTFFVTINIKQKKQQHVFTTVQSLKSHWKSILKHMSSSVGKDCSPYMMEKMFETTNQSLRLR